MKGSALDDQLSRVVSARVARLATVGDHGEPHIVPIVFAVHEDRIVTAVDHKPKRTTDLKRLRNITSNQKVSVLVDHYDDDWSHLWWVRIDGRAEVVATGPLFAAAIATLVEKYQQYRDQVPGGPVVIVTIEQVKSWEAG